MRDKSLKQEGVYRKWSIVWIILRKFSFWEHLQRFPTNCDEKYQDDSRSASEGNNTDSCKIVDIHSRDLTEIGNRERSETAAGGHQKETSMQERKENVIGNGQSRDGAVDALLTFLCLYLATRETNVKLGKVLQWGDELSSQVLEQYVNMGRDVVGQSM